MKRLYLCVRAYGDSLISLRLLHRLPASISDIEILGTAVTEQVAALTELQRFRITRVLPRVAAFFDIKAQGVGRALRDLMTVRRHIARHLAIDDTVLFEQADWRNRLIVPQRHGVAAIPQHGTSIYADRSRLLEQQFGVTIELPQCRRPRVPCRRLVINPGARQPARVIPSTVVSALVAYASRRRISTCLIDPQRLHGALASQVDTYMPAPELAAAAAQLRQADLFIGADSFFLHLAHFYEVPLFAVSASEHPYFAPPGLIENRACLPVYRALDVPFLFRALDNLLAGDSAHRPS